ncbi:MAG: aminotransferase class I/II-fold pyridoxal phosphate-dependent enzyme [Deltaproteobacteria bacterium]|jgi:threonine-phosphate decarboxylase|nr:aminotransferase class I/II-fold pyridoxal phosphate-dependent enzyme [Deltaproteobacteria bacterium]
MPPQSYKNDRPAQNCAGRSSTGIYAQGGHGGEILAAAARAGLNPASILDFSSNTNIFALELTKNLFQQIFTPDYPFTRYPDASCAELSAAIAGLEALEPSNVLCGNGAADLIWLCLRALAPASVLFLGPVFSEYIRACEALKIKYEIIATRPEDEFACTAEAMSRLWESGESSAELTVLCSPNNPGGIAYHNLQNMVAAVRSPRLLVDLSYREFLFSTPDYSRHTWRELSRHCQPGCELLGLHSFTKFFCCPGLRLGYLTGESKSIARLKKEAPAWSVWQAAQDIGCAFIENIEAYRNTLADLAAARQEFGFNLRRFPLFDPDLVLEGPNFYCCGLAGNDLPGGRKRKLDAEAGKLQNFLLGRGLLIRDCDNIPGMPPGFVRIQVRGSKDNERLLDALQRFLLP